MSSSSMTMSTSEGAEYSYVVAGATLSCSEGDQQSKLKMPYSHGVFTKFQPQMNIMDYVPFVNIMPFGKCHTLANPAVASATAANHGTLTPMPCTPVLTTPWIRGKDNTLVAKQPALLSVSTNTCLYCGTIQIDDDGQEP